MDVSTLNNESNGVAPTKGNHAPESQPLMASKPYDNIPLIETETFDPRPPLAESETDLDSDERETVAGPQPGVDDGFFITDRFGDDGNVNDPPNRKPPDVPSNDEGAKPNALQPPDAIDGKTPYGPHQQDWYGRFPYAPGFGPYDPETGMHVGTDLESIPDVNIYQHKKTFAQGMMDLALFSANANQLRYVVESYARHPYYYPSLVLIAISLLFQVAVGVGLIWNSRYNVKDKKEICIANKVNNFTVIGIFLVTVINVFISAFGVANIAPAN